jgi:hypothetical protein
MKKALLALTAIGLSASVFAQGTSDGTIVFKNIGVGNAAGTGTYNVPLFDNNKDNLQGSTYVGNANSAVGAGNSITVGLFLSSNLNTPLATGVLGTTAAQSPYIITPAASQTVSVTGNAPGSTPSLTIRAWTTSAGSFAAAQTTADAQWGEWVITAKPLGGVPAGGGTPITPPSLTGWGSEAAPLGFELNRTAVPEPSTIALGVLGVGALVLARRRK